MAKVVGPLHSMSAKGRFGEAAVFSSWLGRSYVRVWRMHQKEPSLRQLAARKGLTVLSRVWANLPEGAWGAWREFAKGKKPPVPAHCVFLSHALVARDAGLPMPTFPEASSGPLPPSSLSPFGDRLLPDSGLKAQLQVLPTGPPHPFRH